MGPGPQAQDDALFVAAAIGVSFFAALTAFRYLTAADTTDDLRSLLRRTAGAAVAGGGAWATHFMSELTAGTGSRMPFKLGGAGVTLAMCVSGAVLLFNLRGRRAWLVMGLAWGGGSWAMHVLQAAVVAGPEGALSPVWATGALVLGVGGFLMAFGVRLAQEPTRGGWWRAPVAAAIFTGSSFAIHYMVAAATPVPVTPTLLNDVSREGVATAVTSVIFLVVAAAWGVDLIERRTRDARRQSIDLVFRHVPTGMAMYDPDGKLQVMNAAYAQLADEVGFNLQIGGDRTAMIHGLLATGRIRIRDVTEDPANPCAEFTLNDGRVYLVRNHVLADESQVSVIDDISRDRLAAQAAEDARERAEAADAVKSQFLKNMSHELRTPLNGVMGALQIMRMDGGTDRQRKLVDLAMDSAQTLLTVLSDAIDYAAGRSGMLTIEVEPFRPADLVAGVGAALEAAVEGRPLKILTRVHPALKGAEYVGDPLHVRQALGCLAANAVKFTASGQIEVSLQPAGSRLSFVVSDTGPGVAPERLERLFAAFSQDDESDRRKHGGMGLGLALCARLVELMGGSMVADSTPGRGSRFGFVLPLACAAPAAAGTDPNRLAA